MGKNKKILKQVRKLYAKTLIDCEATRGDIEWIALDSFIDDLGKVLEGPEHPVEPRED